MNFWSFLGLASATDMRTLREELQAAKAENEALRVQAAERITAASQEYMSELRELLQAIRQEADALQTGAERDRIGACTAKQELLTALDGAKAELSSILLESRERQGVSERQIMRNLEANRAQGAEAQKQIEALLETSKVEMAGLRELLQKNISQQESAFLKMQEILSDLSEAHGQGLETIAQADAEREQKFHNSLTQLKEDVNGVKEALLDAIGMMDPRKNLEGLKEGQRKLQDTLLETRNIAKTLPEMKDYLTMLWEVTKLVWVNELLGDLENGL